MPMLAETDFFRSVMPRAHRPPWQSGIVLGFEKRQRNERGSADAVTTPSSTSLDRFKKSKEAIANEGERKTRRTPAMCNLYSITTNQAAIIALFRVINRRRRPAQRTSRRVNRPDAQVSQIAKEGATRIP
jgi:hypothetical protein